MQNFRQDLNMFSRSIISIEASFNFFVAIFNLSVKNAQKVW